MDDTNKATTTQNKDDSSPHDRDINHKESVENEKINEVVTEISIPEDAQDSDLIEKEWVDKAKEIVEHTKDNPHEQQRAFNLMKAEYMKKRYNKDIKIDES